jgi:thymidylate synthase
MQSIHILADTLPMAWEQAVVACWREGEAFRTEYDRPDDPPSRDVVAMIHVREPFSEPRIHRAFPGGLEDLEKYRSEVLYGVHDHWIDPDAGKWEYTYHQRLFAYEVPGADEPVDQIAAAVEKLRDVPFTRRAQAVTWQVWNDTNIDDPACLQRIWLRISDGRLHMTCHMRSNDAYKAAFMNMYAFTELQAEIADRLCVQPGEYVHIADSLHIYGSYFGEFEGFLKTVEDRSPQERTFETSFAAGMFLDGCRALLAEDDLPEGARQKLHRRKAALEAAADGS